MSTDIKKLADQRLKAIGAAREILDRAQEESRSTDAEERSQVQKALDEASSLGQAIAVAQEESRIAKLDDKYGGLNEEAEWRRLLPTNSPEEPENTDEDRLRQVLRGERAVLEFKPQDYRALSTGTDSAGGHTVPEGFLPQLMDYREKYSGIRMAGVNVIRTTTGEPLDIPHVLSQGTAALTAEAGTIAGTDPTFQVRTLGAYKYGQLIALSHELVQDNAVNLTGWLAREMGRALAKATEAHYGTGTGSNQPQGIAPAASVGVTGAGGTAAGNSGAPRFDNLIALKYTLDSAYLDSDAGWLMHQSTVARIAAMKDDNDNYLWQPNNIAGEPETLLGFPVYTTPAMPEIGSQTRSILFANFPEAYIIRDAGGVRVERSNEYKFATDEIAMKAVIRTDGRGSYGKASKAFVGGSF